MHHCCHLDHPSRLRSRGTNKQGPLVAPSMYAPRHVMRVSPVPPASLLLLGLLLRQPRTGKLCGTAASPFLRNHHRHKLLHAAHHMHGLISMQPWVCLCWACAGLGSRAVGKNNPAESPQITSSPTLIPTQPKVVSPYSQYGRPCSCQHLPAPHARHPAAVCCQLCRMPGPD